MSLSSNHWAIPAAQFGIFLWSSIVWSPSCFSESPFYRLYTDHYHGSPKQFKTMSQNVIFLMLPRLHTKRHPSPPHTPLPNQTNLLHFPTSKHWTQFCDESHHTKQICVWLDNGNLKKKKKKKGPMFTWLGCQHIFSGKQIRSSRSVRTDQWWCGCGQSSIVRPAWCPRLLWLLRCLPEHSRQPAHTHNHTPIHNHMHTHRHNHMHGHTHIYTHTQSHACAHIHTQSHKHACNYTTACTHTITHMHIHTITHNHILAHNEMNEGSKERTKKKRELKKKKKRLEEREREKKKEMQKQYRHELARYLVVGCVDVTHDGGDDGTFQLLLPLPQSTRLLEVTSETSTGLCVTLLFFSIPLLIEVVHPFFFLETNCVGDHFHPPPSDSHTEGWSSMAQFMVPFEGLL